MRLKLLVFCLVVNVCAFGQVSKPLQFREEIFDFGAIKEQAGAAIHEFSFINNSSRPIKILKVQASCGCTTPDWTKDAIAPGKSGFIQASFNPVGRPGYFNKSLTVTTDFDSKNTDIEIQGLIEYHPFIHFYRDVLLFDMDRIDHVKFRCIGREE